MKTAVPFFFPLMLLFAGNMACRTDNGLEPVEARVATGNTNDTMSNRPLGSRMNIKLGSRTFTATLLDNPTAAAFKTRLPLTVSMGELNGNEKFADLPNELRRNASNLGTIQAGDLMLYGSNTLVLFYETFRTSYSYTKLGRIDNPSGLAAAVGTGSVTVTFELE